MNDKADFMSLCPSPPLPRRQPPLLRTVLVGHPAPAEPAALLPLACIEVGPARLFPSEQRVLVNGAPVVIGKRAFGLLLMLAERPHQLVTKEDMMARVWSGVVVERNNIAVQVMTLRRLLGAELIETVPGRGYRLRAEPVLADGRRPPASGLDATDTGLASPPLLRIGPKLPGRGAELARLAQLFRDAPGWVSLVGPAGAGKSTLARAVAFAWPGATVWLDLAGIGPPGNLPQVLARTMGLPRFDAATRRSLEGALLVLDDAPAGRTGLAEAIGFLRAAAPSMRLLLTARAPICGTGEWVERMAPLAGSAERQAVG